MPTRAIRAIFFTRFHPEKGSRVLHQVPEGAITASHSPSALREPLFHFPNISEYIIPKQEFCDRMLTCCVNHYRVIGYPVCIKGEGKYNRNEFIFNFAVVIDESVEDWGAYGSVVRKLGRLLRGLEEQGGFLSREEEEMWDVDGEDEQEDGMRGEKGTWQHRHQDKVQKKLNELEDKADSGIWDVGPVTSGSKVYALCEMILEDLNNYCECMIPIDDSNTINLKLFPAHDPPAPIYAWHVPLLTIDLNSFSSPTISSDLTLARILPYINGINSVSQISQLADTDLSLTRKAIQHLVYYGCVLLLDIFQYGAMYAPTAEIGEFLIDEALQEECARYVQIPRMTLGRVPRASSAAESNQDNRSSLSSDPRNANLDPITEAETNSTLDARDEQRISKETLIRLYTSLRQGLTLRNWCLENFDLLPNIDVRRLVTFGVIKGFLYRVHKYAIATSSLSASNNLPGAGGHADSDSHTTTIMPDYQRRRNSKGGPQVNGKDDGVEGGLGGGLPDGGLDSLERDALPLIKYLDGMHSFDEICTELKMSERRVGEKMRGIGEVQFIHR